MENETTFLDDIDINKVTQLVAETKNNADQFTSMVKDIANSYASDLDDLMRDLLQLVTNPDDLDTTALERYYAELTNAIYFMGARIEELSAYNNLSKTASKEIYNKSYLANMRKDIEGKNKRTVAENQAMAEMSSQYHSVVATVYEHAYKTVKFKIDAATEMITTLKRILMHRTSEEYLSKQTSTQKQLLLEG